MKPISTSMKLENTPEELMGLIQLLGTERNRQIIKIIFMESMKDKTASVPLFEIWDQSLALHRNFGEDHNIEKWLNDDPRRKVEVFSSFSFRY